MNDIRAESAAHFDVPYYRCLDAEGVPVGPLPASARDFPRLRQLYRTMLLVRTFDQRAVDLQRTGRMGTYASCLGQEAVGSAIGDTMQPDDVLLPSYRETPALLMRGATMTDLLLYWGGDERGMDWAACREDFPLCIPIATHATHAAGVAFAFKYRRQSRAAVCALGDGATSKGDFYEGLNISGVWKLPLLFIVVNNQWAISMPRKAQTGAKTLAQKAIAAGIGCEIVDGNDLIALRERLSVALTRVRAGEPYLIEARTYRLGDHTTADDASRYRSAEEVENYRAADPLLRLRRYLHTEDALNEAEEEALKQSCEEEVESAVTTYLAATQPQPSALFDHLYKTLPAALEWQQRQAEEGGQGCG